MVCVMELKKAFLDLMESTGCEHADKVALVEQLKKDAAVQQIKDEIEMLEDAVAHHAEDGNTQFEMECREELDELFEELDRVNK